MAKQLAAKWRESASLILLSRHNNNFVSSKSFDYKVLLFSRAEKASFMPKSSVFPGGVHEPADQSPLWMTYFKNFGVRLERLNSLVAVGGHRPPIFTKHVENCLEKEISLRITAIRETFEEVGVILCRTRQNLADTSVCGKFIEDFDREHWQQVIHNDPTQFLALCKELDVIPDLWSLHEWSVWMTPSTFKKRFETAFYMVALEESPDIIIEKNEATDYSWKTPLELIQSFQNKKIWLPPPQFYELSRLVNFIELDKLISFAKERSVNGSTLILPVQYKCTDGIVSLLPGDDMYPSDPNETTEFIQTGTTMKDFRLKAQQVHRAEYVNLNKAQLHLNFPLKDGHLPPVRITSRSNL